MKKISIQSMLQAYKYQVLGTFLLLVLENILFLVQPLFIGKAIDGGIAGDYIPLLVMVAIYLCGILIGTVRRIVDTRIYSKMHFHLANQIFENSTEVSISRIELSADVIATINEDIPMFMESLIQIIGALIILAQFRISYLMVSLLLCIMITVIYSIITKRIFKLNRSLNNHYESYINSLVKYKTRVFLPYFRLMNLRRIQLSDLESAVYALLYLGILGMLIFVLIIESSKSMISTGDVFAVLSYVLQFEAGIGDLPYFYQKMIGTNEIIARFNEE
ncbi:MAG: ABC transporter six-transmembrane domain-containing protein [Brevinema sp.]